MAQEDLELGPNNPACTRPISSHLFGILTAAIICPARDALDDKRLRFRFESDKADEIRIDENTALWVPVPCTIRVANVCCFIHT